MGSPLPCPLSGWVGREGVPLATPVTPRVCLCPPPVPCRRPPSNTSCPRSSRRTPASCAWSSTWTRRWCTAPSRWGTPRPPPPLLPLPGPPLSALQPPTPPKRCPAPRSSTLRSPAGADGVSVPALGAAGLAGGASRAEGRQRWGRGCLPGVDPAVPSPAGEQRRLHHSRGNRWHHAPGNNGGEGCPVGWGGHSPLCSLPGDREPSQRSTPRDGRGRQGARAGASGGRGRCPSSWQRGEVGGGPWRSALLQWPAPGSSNPG